MIEYESQTSQQVLKSLTNDSFWNGTNVIFSHIVLAYNWQYTTLQKKNLVSVQHGSIGALWATLHLLETAGCL